MKKLFFFTLLEALPLILFSQLHDNRWHIGENRIRDGWGLSEIRFSDTESPQIEIVAENITASASSLTICDSTGSMLFFTNSKDVFNRNFKVMENGGNISPTRHFYNQATLAIPQPGAEKNKWILFCQQDIPNEIRSQLYWNIIDMDGDNGLGAVVEKRNFVLDSVNFGSMSAVKHANGRDWWIIAYHPGDSDRYFSILVTPDTVQVFPLRSGVPTEKGLGYSNFTPDGSKYYIAETAYIQGKRTKKMS